MTDVPLLSVVMPVRDALPYLDAAVESILSQSFAGFEFVIGDDGSRDGSLAVLRHWAARDARIRLFEGAESLGPVGSSNWVVAQARAPFIARMDADDVCHPERLERQLAILQADAGAVLVGCVWEGIDRFGRVVRPPDLSPIVAGGFGAPFAHSTIMFRRDAYDRIGGYRPRCEFWEDQDLYLRMAQAGRLLVTTKPLFRHRFSETSTRITSQRSWVEAAVDLMFACRAAAARGEDYTPLLARSRPDLPGKRHPYAFLSLGFNALWAGQRTAMLRRLLRGGRLRFDRATLMAIVWASWGAVAPRSLRMVMTLLLERRNRAAAAILGDAELCEWRPGRPGVIVATVPSGMAASRACSGTDAAG